MPVKNKYTPEQYARWNQARRLKRQTDSAYRAKLLAKQKALYQKNRDYYREDAFKRKFKITWAERDAMLAAQGNCCKVCKSPDHGAKSRGWHTDHCHKTGKVRGILCIKCNIMLGYIEDDPSRHGLLVKYLEDCRR